MNYGIFVEIIIVVGNNKGKKLTTFLLFLIGPSRPNAYNGKVMKNTLLALLVLLSLATYISSCTTAEAEEIDSHFNQIIAQADRAVIYAYADNDAKPYQRVRDLEKSELVELGNLMLVETDYKSDCAYDGAIFLFKEAEIFSKMRFSINEKCTYAMYMNEGELHTRKLTANGIETLKQSLNTYTSSLGMNK